MKNTARVLQVMISVRTDRGWAGEQLASTTLDVALEGTRDNQRDAIENLLDEAATSARQLVDQTDRLNPREADDAPTS